MALKDLKQLKEKENRIYLILIIWVLIGYTATQFTKLATLYDNPVKDSNTIHLFLAENAITTGRQRLDDTEDIEVVLIPIQKALAKIRQGEICVCGSVTAIFLGLDCLENRAKFV